MSWSVTRTVQTIVPCPFKQDCPAKNAVWTAGCPSNLEKCTGKTETVSVTQSVVQVHIDIENSRLYWTVKGVYDSREIYRHYYNCNSDLLFPSVGVIGPGGYIWEDNVLPLIEGKTDVIDAMPESIQGEVDAKNLLYGIGYVGSPQRIEEITL